MELRDGGSWWKTTPEQEKSPILTKSHSLFSPSLAGLKSGLRTFQFQTSAFCPWRRKNSWLVENSWNFKVSCKWNVNHLESQQLWPLVTGQGPYVFPETCLDQFQPVMANAGKREKVKVAGFPNEMNSFLLNNKLEPTEEFWHGIISWQ